MKQSGMRISRVTLVILLLLLLGLGFELGFRAIPLAGMLSGSEHLSLSAQQQPVLQVSPTSLEFQGQVGGPTPDPQYLTIINAGGSLMEWHASADVEWIILGAEGGKLSGGRVIQLLVLVDIEGLEAGEYQGTITIEAPGAQGSPVEVEVTLTLQPAYTVCPSGCRYSSIGEAIAAARSGETITIGPGTYEENLEITKSLTLKGAGKDRTEIKIKGKAGGEPVIRIESDSEIEVTLEGLMIAEANNGILISGKAILIIRNSQISGNGYGIGMWGSSQATISDSEISGNGWDGILMWGSSQAEISNSQISGNRLDGIWMGYSSRATISGSTISGNGYYGIWMGGSSQATISDSTISGNGKDGIWMEDSSQATIRGNKIFDNGGYGVALWQRPCFDTDEKFKGKVEGSGNEIRDNGKGAVCPSELEFLRTEEGGCYGPKC